jgi:flagellar biogenesis protein FliO
MRITRFIPVLLLLLLVTAAHAATDPAPAERPFTDFPSYGKMLWNTLVTLFAIIAGLIVAAKFASRWLVKHPDLGRGKLIEVVEYRRLEPRRGIYLIKIAGQYLVVGSSEQGLRTLAGSELDQHTLAAALRKSEKRPEILKDAPSEPRAFSEVMGNREELNQKL